MGGWAVRSARSVTQRQDRSPPRRAREAVAAGAGAAFALHGGGKKGGSWQPPARSAAFGGRSARTMPWDGHRSAEALVDGGRGVLDDGQSAEHLHRHLLAADLEVLERALRLRAPVLVGGDADDPHGVALLAETRGARAVARVAVEMLTMGHDSTALRHAVGLHELQQPGAHAHMVLVLLRGHLGAFLTNSGRVPTGGGVVLRSARAVSTRFAHGRGDAPRLTFTSRAIPRPGGQFPCPASPVVSLGNCALSDADSHAD